MTTPDDLATPDEPAGPAPSGEFDTLVEALLDGELHVDGVARLQQLLDADPHLAAEAAARLEQHRLLGLLHRPGSHDAAVDDIVAAVDASERDAVEAVMSAVPRAAAPATGSRLLRVAAVAAALALLVAAAVAIWPPAGAADRDPRAVASLLIDQDVEWDGPSPIEGERLGRGLLGLRKGLAVVRFDGGAEAVLTAPARLELLSPGSARLHRGRVFVRAPEEASGFVLLTPESELLDLGTEFSVRVSDEAGTALDVLEGEVVVRPLAARKSDATLLKAGQAATVATPKSVPRQAAFSSPRFAEVIEKARLRSRWELTHAYEGFHYPAGRVPLAESVRGKGWAGPWRARRGPELTRGQTDATDATDASDGLAIVSGKMNVTWPVPGGRAGMLELPPGFTARVRQMARPIDLGRDGVVYLSLMVREPPHPVVRGRRDPETPREAVRLTFRSTDDYFGPSLSFGLSGKQRPQILTGLGIGVRSSQPAPEDQSTLWLGKIVCREDGPDQAFFRIYAETEPLGYAEPGDWDVVASGLDLSAALDLVVLTSAGQSPRVVDELRVGPTFRSVAPMPEPTVQPQAATARIFPEPEATR